MGIDVWEVVNAAKTKPFGFMPFYPGPGLGGHCIPIDPFYLSWKARQAGFEARFIELAGHVNSAMPHYVADKVSEALNTHRKAVNGSSVLVLGIAYKKDIDDIRESPALDIIRLLEQQGAKVTYHDPHVASFKEDGHEMKSVPFSADQVAAADCVMIVTDHSSIDYRMVRDKAKLVVDTRHAMPKAG